MNTTTRRGILHTLEDFRMLPFFVITSMAVGIELGKVWGISNYQLTPPIEAIKRIIMGTFQPTIPNAISLGVPMGLFIMMYPAMTKVRPEGLRAAIKSPRQLSVVAFFNYAIAPFFMLALAYVFLGNYPEFFAGVVLYGFAPCIAMVIVFTYLAGGNNAMALVLVSFNSIVQMLLIPVYAQLLLGNISFDVLIVGESVVLYLGLPLASGILTRRIGVSRFGEEGFGRKYDPILSALSIMGLLFTLVVMFSLKGDLILDEPWIVGIIAIPMIIFFFVMFNSVFFLGRRIGLDYEDSVAVAFNSTGRDFEIAIAVAITAFTPAVALATVVGPLIEVPVMLTLVWIAKRTRALWKVEKFALKAIPASKPSHLKGQQVLFVCVENSCRSQMAEATFNHLASTEGVDARAVSAGTRPAAAVNPLAVQVLRGIGIDASHQKPKLLTQEMLNKADNIIMMGCLAKDVCPAVFLPKTEDWGIEDPSGKPIGKFREVGDIIKDKVEELLSNLLRVMLGR